MGEESLSKLEEEQIVVSDATLEEVPHKQRRWLTPLFVGTGLGIAIACVAIQVASNQNASQPKTAGRTAQNIAPAMTVTLVPVETTRVTRTLNVTGTVQARELIPVLPQANGLQIKQIPSNIKQGAFINKGDVLALLDDSILQEQIRQAKADVESKQAIVDSKQADLQSKQAAVSSTQATADSSQAAVAQTEASLGQAKAKLADSQRTYDRDRTLFAQGAISRQQLDTAATDLETAKQAINLAQANISSAKANASSAKAGIGSSQANVNISQANINSAEADVRSSAAKVQQLKAQLGQTVIRAPVSGTIAEVLARVGDVTGVAPQTQVGTVVGGSQKLFSIITSGLLELQALVPEVQLQQVRNGAEVEITADGDSTLHLEGRVREIDPVIDQKTRQATVKIDLPPTNLFKPGMFAQAAITTATTIGMALPQKATLVQTDGSAIVFTLSGEDTVHAQKVELGEIINGGKVEIKSGLNPSDRVVVSGAGYLKDGDKVRIVNG